MRVRYGNHIHKKWEMEIYLQECLHVLNQLFFINLHGSFNYKESRFIITDTVFILILDFKGEIMAAYLAIPNIDSSKHFNMQP